MMTQQMNPEPFGSLYAMRQQQEAERRQAMKGIQSQVDADLDRDSGIQRITRDQERMLDERQLALALCIAESVLPCPENPTYPRSSCQWHYHREEGANLTYRDKAFYFTTQARVPGTEIRSPGQWKRFLKQHNLTDDLSIKDHMELSSRGYAEKKRKERVEKLKQEARKVFSQHVYESTVYKH